VSQYQKGKTNLDFTEARDSEWQWHKLGYMQVCTSLQRDNHASTTPLSFFTDQMPFLSFFTGRIPSCRQTNSIKALKAKFRPKISYAVYLRNVRERSKRRTKVTDKHNQKGHSWVVFERTHVTVIIVLRGYSRTEVWPTVLCLAAATETRVGRALAGHVRRTPAARGARADAGRRSHRRRRDGLRPPPDGAPGSRRAIGRDVRDPAALVRRAVDVRTSSKLLTHARASVADHYNLVPVGGQRRRAAGKVTVGLVRGAVDVGVQERQGGQHHVNQQPVRRHRAQRIPLLSSRLPVRTRLRSVRFRSAVSSPRSCYASALALRVNPCFGTLTATFN